MYKKQAYILLLLSFFLFGCQKVQETKSNVKQELKVETAQVDKKDFGLYTNMSQQNVLKLKNHYKKLIISEGEIYSQHQSLNIKKKNATKLYTTFYINKSNKDYKKLPKSKDIDLSNKKYFDDLKLTMKALKTKQFDGIYLYGFDQYDEISSFNSKKAQLIYTNLNDFLAYLHKINLEVYLCDGQLFTIDYLNELNKEREALEAKIVQQVESGNKNVDVEKDIPNLITGVFAKEVFTIYNPKTKVTKKQKTDISRQFKDFFEFVKKYKVNVEICEFTTNSDWQAVVRTYCKNRDYNYYFLKDKNLNKEV